MRIKNLLGFLPYAFLLGGCEPAPSGTSDLNTWDSAGVRYVDVAVPDQASLPQLKDSPDPAVSVGEVEGDEPYLLEWVFGARRTPEGGLLVLNYGDSPGVRVYGPDGEFLRYMGRAGEGPGEFRGPESMHTYRGDSLAVWDHILRRFSIFSSGGELGREIKPPATWGGVSPSALGSLPDGGFLFIRQAWSPGRPNLGDGWEMTHAELLGDQGQFIDTIAELPLVQLQLSPQGRWEGMEFGGLGVPAEVESGFIWCRTDLGELRVYDLSGVVHQVVRLRAGERPITAEIWDRHLQWQEAQWAETMSPENLARSLERMRTRSRAVTAPILSNWIRSFKGVLWLQPFTFPWEDASPYLLLDLERGWLGSVEIPPNSKIHDVGEDYVVVVRKDELGVEHVEAYSISEPGGGEG